MSGLLCLCTTDSAVHKVLSDSEQTISVDGLTLGLVFPSAKIEGVGGEHSPSIPDVISQTMKHNKVIDK